MSQAEGSACAKALRQKGLQACEVLVQNLQKPPCKVLAYCEEGHCSQGQGECTYVFLKVQGTKENSPRVKDHE